MTCSAYGAVDAASRTSRSRFVCTNCGRMFDADVNAAKNITRYMHLQMQTMCLNPSNKGGGANRSMISKRSTRLGLICSCSLVYSFAQQSTKTLQAVILGLATSERGQLLFR